MTCCLKGGHVAAAKNSISATRDGKIAAVAEHIDAVAALKVVDANGLYVTPGLIDVHVHVYTGTGERNSYAGIRTQATTACIRTASLSRGCDHGGRRRPRELEKSEEFKQRIIDRLKTRVPAFLNAQKRHTILGRNGPRWKGGAGRHEGPARRPRTSLATEASSTLASSRMRWMRLAAAVRSCTGLARVRVRSRSSRIAVFGTKLMPPVAATIVRTGAPLRTGPAKPSLQPLKISRRLA